MVQIIQKQSFKNILENPQVPTKNHPTTSCKSSNPGHPDSDKKITNSPPKIIQQHPENPQILEILIQTKKSPTPTKNHPTTSCKSSNPGHRSDII